MVTSGAKEDQLLEAWGRAGEEPATCLVLPLFCSQEGSASINSNVSAKTAVLRSLKLSSQPKQTTFQASFPCCTCPKAVVVRR